MRELGNGRWDKILMRRMLELSESNDWLEAREEWLATGDVWWSGNGETPDWVINSEHANKCLCGHNIVYHFRITNTLNGKEEIVGSDHINSYLIMRQIAQERSVEVGEVSDEEVKKWLNERVGSMKAESWWAANGASFEMMFNKVKEIDCWENTRLGEYEYSHRHQQAYQIRVLRKRADGEFGSEDYKMASIVWRWNHPANPRRQISTRGYPNERLMQDLSLYFALHDARGYADWKLKREARANGVAKRAENLRIAKEKRVAEEAERRRLKALEWERTRPERERKEREAKERARLEAIKKAEALKKLNIETINFDTEVWINFSQLVNMPLITARTLQSPQDWSDIPRIKRDFSHTMKDPSSTLWKLRRFWHQNPTAEQIAVIRSNLDKLKDTPLHGLDFVLTRLQVETYLQEAGI